MNNLKMRDKLPYFVVFVLYQVSLVKAQTTAETILLETTTEYVTVVTDIPKSDVELAMNLDYGTYTTEIFPYINSQYDRSQLFEKCFDDYTKCLITQGPAHPVCGMNNPLLPPHQREKGFIQFNSYCDVYFDNCKKQMRFWRILGTGRCTFAQKGELKIFYTSPTRKFLENLPLFLKKILKSITVE